MENSLCSNENPWFFFFQVVQVTLIFFSHPEKGCNRTGKHLQRGKNDMESVFKEWFRKSLFNLKRQQWHRREWIFLFFFQNKNKRVSNKAGSWWVKTKEYSWTQCVRLWNVSPWDVAALKFYRSTTTSRVRGWETPCGVSTIKLPPLAQEAQRDFWGLVTLFSCLFFFPKCHPFMAIVRERIVTKGGLLALLGMAIHIFM